MSYTPERSGPLSLHERVALARLLRVYPAPIGVRRWIKDAKDTGPANEQIGQCELEFRAWCRVRGRGGKRAHLTVELTQRCFREMPDLSDPSKREAFIAGAAVDRTLAEVAEAATQKGPAFTAAQAVTFIAARAADLLDDLPADFMPQARATLDNLLAATNAAGLPGVARELRQAVDARAYIEVRDASEHLAAHLGEETVHAVLNRHALGHLVIGLPSPAMQ